jgi:transposase
MVGIDVSKQWLSVCCWDSGQGRAGRRWQVPNCMEGVARLLEETAPGEPWALEPTGRYSELVARVGKGHGRTVLLAPPRAAKQFLASLHPRAKTDRLDAQGLAQYAASVPLRPFALKDEAMDTLGQLLSARRSLALSLSSIRQQLQALPRAQEPLQAAAAALAEQIKAVDREIAQRARQEPAVARLQEVPGVGPVTAAALVVRLKTTAFSTYDQFVAYLGLDLRVCDSGERRGRRVLSRHGDAELRRLLYCCAQASLRTKGSPFAQQYERERAKGLASTQALCAVARKMAKVAWAMVRSGAEYDPQRVYTRRPLDKQP